MKDQIESFLHNEYGKSGIDGIVKLIKLNYAMNSIPVDVSGTGNIIKIDIQEPEAVKEYLAFRYILDHDEDYTDEQLDPIKTKIAIMRGEILRNKQSPQDRMAFLNANVTCIKYSIGGVHLVDYEIV